MHLLCFFHSVHLTSLSWPSGSHPWLWFLTTSPTELQIGPAHNAPDPPSPAQCTPGHTPFLPLSCLAASPLSIPSLLFIRSGDFSESISPAFIVSSWQPGGGRWSDSGVSSAKPELTKLLPRETKVVCSIIQAGAAPTAASATLTLTNGQKNRWLVHS